VAKLEDDLKVHKAYNLALLCFTVLKQVVW
jgi:hypothetical protein